jgi:hypothetical protein
LNQVRSTEGCLFSFFWQVVHGKLAPAACASHAASPKFTKTCYCRRSSSSYIMQHPLPRRAILGMPQPNHPTLSLPPLDSSVLHSPTPVSTLWCRPRLLHLRHPRILHSPPPFPPTSATTDLKAGRHATPRPPPLTSETSRTPPPTSARPLHLLSLPAAPSPPRCRSGARGSTRRFHRCCPGYESDGGRGRRWWWSSAASSGQIWHEGLHSLSSFPGAASSMRRPLAMTMTWWRRTPTKQGEAGPVVIGSSIPAARLLLHGRHHPLHLLQPPPPPSPLPPPPFPRCTRGNCQEHNRIHLMPEGSLMFPSLSFSQNDTLSLSLKTTVWRCRSAILLEIV